MILPPRIKRSTVALLVLLHALILKPLVTAALLDRQQSHPKLHRALQAEESAVVPNEFIVVLKKDDATIADAADDVVSDLLKPFEKDWDTQVLKGKAAFEAVIPGFSAKLSPVALFSLLEDDRVAYIEENVLYSVASFQFNAPWHLDRIDQDILPLDNVYGYVSMGAGVDVYVLDTGLDYQHSDFQGRASCAFDVFGEDCKDVDGHGTHVAGIVGSTTYGIAKGVSVHGVRICDPGGSCSTDNILDGLNFVLQTACSGGASKKCVVNASIFGLTQSPSIEEARQSLVAAGVPIVWAAGNWRRDACGSLADSNSTIAVGATTSNDKRWSISNFGPCVDIWAPGDDIISTRTGGGSLTVGGTSQAAPLVAGAAALLLEEGIEPANVLSTLLERSVQGVLVFSAQDNSNNLLLQVPHNLTFAPSQAPSNEFSMAPSSAPSSDPTLSLQPSSLPSLWPSAPPSAIPSPEPTNCPSKLPSEQPTKRPSFQPSGSPSVEPSGVPSTTASQSPSFIPSSTPSISPTLVPTPSSAPVSVCPVNRIGIICLTSWRCCPEYSCQNRQLRRLFLGECSPVA